jgi:hypothetical protein
MPAAGRGEGAGWEDATMLTDGEIAALVDEAIRESDRGDVVLAKRTKYNPERRTWRGKSYKAGGKRVREMKERLNYAPGRVVAGEVQS